MGKRGGRISNSLRALREQRGAMTQQALADAVGVTRQTINAIEGNKYCPSLEVAFHIAQALDVPLESAFHFERS